jgi:hypothetical protein
MEINECILGMALANNGLHTDWMMIRLRSDKEILNKIEELQKIRFEHSKICQMPLDKCDEAKEYAYLLWSISVLF